MGWAPRHSGLGAGLAGPRGAGTAAYVPGRPLQPVQRTFQALEVREHTALVLKPSCRDT